MNIAKFAERKAYISALLYAELQKEGILEPHETATFTVHIASHAPVEIELTNHPLLDLPEDLDSKCAILVGDLGFTANASTRVRSFVTLGALARSAAAGMLQRYGRHVGAKAARQVEQVLNLAGLASRTDIPLGPKEEKILMEAPTLRVLRQSYDIEADFPTIGSLLQAATADILEALRRYIRGTNIKSWTPEGLYADIEKQLKTYGLFRTD